MKNSATENSKLHKIANKREEKLQIFALAKQKNNKNKRKRKKTSWSSRRRGRGRGSVCMCVREPEANTTNLLGANLTISPMRRE